MNKKILTALIALMGISILVIVIVQLVWMNKAIHVKNELFDRSVNEALTNTTNRLENMQDFRMINRNYSEHSFIFWSIAIKTSITTPNPIAAFRGNKLALGF